MIDAAEITAIADIPPSRVAAGMALNVSSLLFALYLTVGRG